MTRIGIAILAGAALVPVACARTADGDDPGPQAMAPVNERLALPGTWEGTLVQDNGIVRSHRIAFGPDGSFKGSTTYDGSAIPGPIERSGTWKVIEDRGPVLTVEVEFPVRSKDGPLEQTTKTVYSVRFEDANSIEFSLARPDARPLRLKRKN